MIIKTQHLREGESMVILLEEPKKLPAEMMTGDEYNYIIEQKEKKEKELILLNRLNRLIFIQFIKKETFRFKRLENCRIAGDKIACLLNEHKIGSVTIYDTEDNFEETLALAEGMALGNYQFLRYKKEPVKKKNTLKSIHVYSHKVTKRAVEMLNIRNESTFRCRDLINEPVIHLTATALSAEIEKMGKEVGADVEVLNKKKIESLKLGGLLAVNRGSAEPPTFTTIEWKPKKPVNKKPYVLVGKGVVFDTGGLNIKTGNYMDNMKYDMAGAAAVSAVLYAVAKAKLPLHVVGLIPATDNRLSGNAYAPGDVIFMHSGTTVEVMNTDAEGRMIMADALSYAKRYDPELVIDIATLTGSAALAIGKYGIVAMKAKTHEEFETLKQSGEAVYERLVEFPFWEEYGELIKSEVAEIKNIGPREGGAITAGKFLEHFTDYPYIHLDIAGPGFSEKKDSYRGMGGTGVGVRLLFDFLLEKSRKS